MFKINVARALASVGRIFCRGRVQGVRLSVPEQGAPPPRAGSQHPGIKVATYPGPAHSSRLQVEVMCLQAPVRDLDIRLVFTPDQGLDTGIRDCVQAGDIRNFSFELPNTLQPCQLSVLVSYITPGNVRRTWEFTRRVEQDGLGGLVFLPVNS